MPHSSGGGGIIIVISGPSGVGKSTICKRLAKDMDLKRSVSATTRKPRKGEKDGTDYHFISEEEFKKRIKRGAFIEHVKLFGNYYGTPLSPIREAIKSGETRVLDIDVHGAITLRKKKIAGIYILVSPPNMETLEERLKGRKTESDQQLAQRLKLARWELKQTRYYDYVVKNDSIEEAVEKIKATITKHFEKSN